MSGVVVALIGLPGAGKSTLARYLAQAFALHIVDRDAIRAAMFPACRYSDAEKRAANAAVLSAVAAHCRLQQSSVVDGMTFARRREFNALDDCVRAQDFELLGLFVDCPAEVAAIRVERDPAHPAADRNGALVRQVATRFERPDAACIRIAADTEIDAMTAAAHAAVERAIMAAAAPPRPRASPG